MITVVNTVGTSIITNFLQKNPHKLNHIYEMYEKESYSKDETLSNEYTLLKDTIKKWIKNQSRDKICAEIKSLMKIKDKYEDDVVAYFLSTDTILSVMSAEVIVEYLKECFPKDKYIFKKDKHVILKTDVHNNYYFKHGIQNLINVLDKCEHYVNIINFSGGYKSLIPYLTLYATIKDISLSYIYEDSDALIEIPPLPLHVDFDLLEKLEDYFYKIDKECSIPYPKELYNFEEKYKQVFEICTEKENENYTLSAIGFMLWEEYKKIKKDINLVEVDTPANKKDIKLSSTHHGNDKLQAFSERIVNSPYVVEVLDSLPYNPRGNKFIRSADEDGTLEIVLYKDDRGLGLRIKTTGRNLRETLKIGEILEQKYYS